MKKYILIFFVLANNSIFAQINIQNSSNGGVTISPNGILANFPDSKKNDTTNISIGENALLNNPAGSKRHIAIGKNALKNYTYIPDILLDPDSSSQIAIGYGALAKHNPTIDGSNIAIGVKAMGNVTFHDAGNNISIGQLNMQNAFPRNVISIGHKTLIGLQNNQNGQTNETTQSIYIGNEIGLIKSDGDRNTVIGHGSFRTVAGSNNTILGFEAGYNLGSAENSHGNVLIGSFAGKLETGSDKLYIENANITNPLIGGNFFNDRVGINREISLVNTTNRTFQVEGTTLITDTLQLTKGAGVGKVLTSDAVGNGSWQSIPTGNWQQNGAYISNTNPNGFWSPYSSPLPITADNISNPPASPTTGNGTRMAWIPSRSAFQGGTYNMADGSVRFVSENIGLFSFCYGLNSESRSRGGVAMGEGAIADGSSNTIAFGENVQVRGHRNIGLGFGNEIQDGSSNTIAMGEGIRNTGGEYVNSMGWGLNTSGYGTSFFGTFNTVPTGSLNSWVGSDPLFVIGNGQPDGIRSNALTILKNGNLGIGITNPSKMWQVRKGSSGVTPNGNSQAFLESNTHMYLGFGVPNNSESGILFGRPDKGSTSGGIIYTSSKSLVFRTLANVNRMIIDSLGNVGIGTLNPIAKLDVKGTTKIGINGTELVEVIRAEVGPLALFINTDATATITYTVSNVQPGSTIIATPASVLPSGVLLDAYCISANSIIVRFYNASASAKNITDLPIQLTIIR